MNEDGELWRSVLEAKFGLYERGGSPRDNKTSWEECGKKFAKAEMVFKSV